jgi:membrane protease YdiL (CAAX protease family)
MIQSNHNIPESISDKRRKREILAVLLTGAGKLIFMDLLHWKLLFILVSIVGWSAYVIYRSREVKGILSYWGFRTDNFKEVTLKILPFGIISVVAFLAVGYFRHTINFNWHIIPILIFYPIWGVIQQFLVIGLVAGNLQDLKENKLSAIVIISLTAVLFGLVHYPYYWLIAGTFVLALVYGFIYLKARNVYVMGLFHGWLGGLFFYTVVDRDPFAEVFGKLFSQ